MFSVRALSFLDVANTKRPYVARQIMQSNFSVRDIRRDPAHSSGVSNFAVDHL